jgi:Bacterial dnaA protein helix-turn-helix
MMLTELYYYYANHPTAKAARSSLSPTAGKAAGTTAVMSAADLRRNRETAPECELSLDRQSRNELTGTLQKQRDGPRRQTRTAPNPATRYELMDRLPDHIFFLSYAHPDRPQLPDAVLDTLVSALRASVAHPDQAVQALARTTLSEVRGIQAAARRRLAVRRPALLIEQIASALQIEADQLRSRARSQHLAFQRQLAMYLVRKISAVSFPVVAAAFGRDHSTVIHACQLIERRMAHDGGFRRFIEQLERQVFDLAAATQAAA